MRGWEEKGEEKGEWKGRKGYRNEGVGRREETRKRKEMKVFSDTKNVVLHFGSPGKNCDT